MGSSLGMLIGLSLVCLGAVTVVLVLESSNAPPAQKTMSRLMLAHRAGGYLFVIIFSIMAYFMSRRLVGLGLSNKLPTHLVVHVILALLLIPLLFLKVLIARRYKQTHSLLMPLGLAIFAITFVLVSLPALSELLKSANPGTVLPRIVVISIVAICLLLFGTVLWPKKKRSEELSTSTGLLTSANTKRPGETLERGTMHLVLESIRQETHDTKTLRFRVPRE